jgi:hypothetical protein
MSCVLNRERLQCALCIYQSYGLAITGSEVSKCPQRKHLKSQLLAPLLNRLRLIRQRGAARMVGRAWHRACHSAPARTARSSMITTALSTSSATPSSVCSVASKTGVASRPTSIATSKTSWPLSARRCCHLVNVVSPDPNLTLCSHRKLLRRITVPQCLQSMVPMRMDTRA